MNADGTLSIALFSGTDDRLQAAATLIVGAAAMDRSVHVLVQFWALDAFRADRIRKDHGVSPEAGAAGLAAMQRHGAMHWADVMTQAKDLGNVTIRACAQSMEMLSLDPSQLDELIDGVEGVASFMADASASIVFI